MDALHPVGLFREDVDDQLLVFRCPPFVFWMRVNGGLDIDLDVPILLALVMQGYAVGD